MANHQKFNFADVKKLEAPRSPAFARSDFIAPLHTYPSALSPVQSTLRFRPHRARRLRFERVPLKIVTLLNKVVYNRPMLRPLVITESVGLPERPGADLRPSEEVSGVAFRLARCDPEAWRELYETLAGSVITSGCASAPSRNTAQTVTTEIEKSRASSRSDFGGVA